MSLTSASNAARDGQINLLRAIPEAELRELIGKQDEDGRQDLLKACSNLLQVFILTGALL